MIVMVFTESKSIYIVLIVSYLDNTVVETHALYRFDLRLMID